MQIVSRNIIKYQQSAPLPRIRYKRTWSPSKKIEPKCQYVLVPEDSKC